MSEEPLIGKMVICAVIFAFLLLMVVGSYQGIITQNEENKACKDIGYSTGKYIFEGKDICLGNEGRATFAKFNCDGWFSNTKCTAIPIEIGTYRITQEVS